MGLQIFVVVIVYLFAIGILLVALQHIFPDGSGLSFLNPRELYVQCNVNRFGAIFVGIILNLLFAPVAFFYWICKLCTMGRD